MSELAPVARGFIPAGARSGPEKMGPLRSPTGINPLATETSSNKGSVFILRPAIGRETVRAQQQRDVVVLISLLDLEDHRNFREERLVLDLLVVLAGLEHHAVFTGFEWLFGREQFGDPPLLVSGALSQCLPVLADVFFQGDVDAR